MIRLSLIIPTHNRAGQLLAALESVVRRTCPPGSGRCVVVNNNSTDDTPARFGLRGTVSGAQPAHGDRDRPGVSMPATGDRGNFGALHGLHRRRRTYQCGFIRAYVEFFDAHPDAVVAGGASLPSMSRTSGVDVEIYRTACRQPDGFRPCRTAFPAGRVPGEATWLSAAPQPPDTAVRPLAGRVGRMLIGGEENDFFERMMRGGETCWYVPDAVMWHIIPPGKLTEDYFRRLATSA